MRVAVLSVEGSCLPWSARMRAEGCDVLQYTVSPMARRVGEGLIPLEHNREKWLAWGTADSQTLWFFDCTSGDEYDSGALADRLRATGKFVVGGGTFMDRLEKDRSFGVAIAAKVGIMVPPTHEFSSVREAVAFIKSDPRQEAGDGGWAWKSDRDLGMTFVGDAEKVSVFLEMLVLPKFGDRIKCIVQERVKGTTLMTARWWNGVRFTGPFEGTLEHQALCNDDKGPGTGCSVQAVWFYRESYPKIARALRWEALEAEFRKRNAPPGLYDLNAIADRRGAWFLEWTPRLGVDAEMTSQRAISNLSEFLMRLARGQDVDDLFDIEQTYMSTRIWVPPYPARKVTMDSPAMGVPVLGADGIFERHFVAGGVRLDEQQRLVVADPYGIVGIAMAAETSFERGFEEIDDYLDEMKVPQAGWRTDGAAALTKDVEELAKAGWHTSDILEDEESAA